MVEIDNVKYIDYYKDSELFFHSNRDYPPFTHSFGMHAHEIYELQYLISGQGSIYIEGMEYPIQPSCIYLIRSNEVHYTRLTGTEPYERIILHFFPNILDSIDPKHLLLVPFDEHLLGNNNFYFLEKHSKLMIENIMDDYDKAYGLKSVRLRYFNVAGADSSTRVGEWHNPETHLIPNILKSTFSGGKTFEMYGQDYDTKDGTCVRDYINVEDLADAHVLALKYLENGGITNFFNLGTQEGNSVREVFASCERVTKKNIPVKEMPRRDGDPAILVADNKKAKELLKWSPERTLEHSIKTAFDWEKTFNKVNV